MARLDKASTASPAACASFARWMSSAPSRHCTIRCMPPEMAFGHEGCNRPLCKRRRSGIPVQVRARTDSDQRLRRDEITEPQAGEQNLAEASRIKYAVVPIDALQCR